MISIEEAFEFLLDHVAKIAPVKVELKNAVGRILATDILADVDSPPHKKSIMDGYAIRSDDVNGGVKRLKVIETVVAGSWPTKSIGVGTAARIMTGAPVPEGADAVVMIEHTNQETVDAEEWVVINTDSIEHGKHTMERATNFAKGNVIFRAGHRIRPSDIGLLAEVGADKFLAGSTPSVAFLPTGDELVSCDKQPSDGQIRNSNGPMLLAMANSLGLKTTDLGIGRDNQAELEIAVRQGLEQDLFVLSGGVSAGLLDLVPAILKNEGVEQIFHHVKVKPGKPIWFGVLKRDGRRCCVFGLPGNPVSSLVGFHLFVRTAIRKMEGDPNPIPQGVNAVLVSAHETRGDRPTYWPGRWVLDESSERKVEPLIWNGSSDLLALGAAEGLIYFPGESIIHNAGKVVPFFPFS